MKNSIVSILAVGLATSATAEVPVYRDQTLVIKEALVVTDDGVSYYTDIKMEANPDGSFKLVQAQRLDLAHVNDVTVEFQDAPFEISVEVNGELPTPCHQLEEPVVVRDGTEFTVVLARRELQTFVVCAQVIEPFTISVPLTNKALEAGHYTVTVNGQETAFDVDGMAAL
ncbi:MAG: hypothetical protein V4628_07725 [Pseudomonadota bacterium]